MAPVTELPFLNITAAEMAAQQAKRLKKLKGASNELVLAIDELSANRDITDRARSVRKAKLREAFVGNLTTTWEEMLEAAALAEALRATHFTDAAIKSRAVIEAKAGDTAARMELLSSFTDPSDLYEAAVEAGRTFDFVLASLVAAETRARLVVEEISPNDGGAIFKIIEAVPLPADEIAKRTALEDVQIAGLEADTLFRQGSTGRKPGPGEVLNAKRKIDEVRGEKPQGETPDLDRFERQRLEKLKVL